MIQSAWNSVLEQLWGNWTQQRQIITLKNCFWKRIYKSSRHGATSALILILCLCANGSSIFTLFALHQLLRNNIWVLASHTPHSFHHLCLRKVGLTAENSRIIVLVTNFPNTDIREPVTRNVGQNFCLKLKLASLLVDHHGTLFKKNMYASELKATHHFLIPFHLCHVLHIWMFVNLKEESWSLSWNRINRPIQQPCKWLTVL